MIRELHAAEGEQYFQGAIFVKGEEVKRADLSDEAKQQSQTSDATVSQRGDNTNSLRHEGETSSQPFDLRTMVFRYQGGKHSCTLTSVEKIQINRLPPANR